MDVKYADQKTRSKVAGNLAKNLRRLMAERGKTAYRVAKDADITMSRIYLFLDAEAESDPAVSTIVKLCKALDCEIGELVSL